MLRRVHIAILIGLFLACHSIHGQEPLNVDVLLELSNSDRWSDVVNTMVDQRASAVNSLREVARNENIARSVRVKAVELLGLLGTREAASVLLENISFRAAIWMRTDEDMLKEFPCTLALINLGWESLPEVFEFLKAPRQDLELFQLAVLLLEMPGRSMARVLLAAELEAATGDIYRGNLEKLLYRLR